MADARRRTKCVHMTNPHTACQFPWSCDCECEPCCDAWLMWMADGADTHKRAAAVLRRLYPRLYPAPASTPPREG